MTNEEKLYETLKDLRIDFEKVEHPAFDTCEKSGDFYQKNKLGVNCKNIFLQNRRGKKHYLVTMLAEKQLDIPRLAEFLEEHRKMGFASAERLNKYLGLQPGSVTPFAIINENAKDIPVIIDKEIFKHEFVHFHPLRNTATLKISTKDFRKFLEQYSDSNDFLEFEFFDFN